MEKGAADLRQLVWIAPAVLVSATVLVWYFFIRNPSP